MKTRDFYITGTHIGRAVFSATASIIWLGGLFIVLYILSGFIRDIGFFENWGNALSEPYINIILGVACLALAFIVVLIGSPLGEHFLKVLFNMRRMTQREEKILFPVLEELKKQYEKKFSEPLKMNVYIVDSNFLNGFAFGYSTIAVHRTALEQLDKSELKALLAHEIGHLHHKDGGYSTLLLGLHSPISIHMKLSNFRGEDRDTKKERMSKNRFIQGIGFIKFVLFLPFIIASFIAMPFLWCAKLMQNMGAWQKEYRADHFAVEMGQTKGMISLLEKLLPQDERDRHGFMAKYGFSHPPTALRIDEIERKIK